MSVEISPSFEPIELDVGAAGGIMDQRMRWERQGPFRNFVYSFANEIGGPWTDVIFHHVVAHAYYGSWDLQPDWVGVNRIVRNPEFPPFRRGPHTVALEYGAFIDGGGAVTAVCELVALRKPDDAEH